MAKKLVRIEDRKMIGGICAGLAEYVEIDVSLVRILFVAVGLITAVFPMALFYIIAWIIIPAGAVVENEKSDPPAGKDSQAETKK